MKVKFIVSCILLLSCVSCDFKADPIDLGSTSTSIINPDNRSDATSGIGSGDHRDSGSGTASSSSAGASYAGDHSTSVAKPIAYQVGDRIVLFGDDGTPCQLQLWMPEEEALRRLEEANIFFGGESQIDQSSNGFSLENEDVTIGFVRSDETFILWYFDIHSDKIVTELGLRVGNSSQLMENYYGEYSEKHPDDNDKSIMGYYYLNGYTPDVNVYYGGISSYRMVFSGQGDIVIEWSMSPQD